MKQIFYPESVVVIGVSERPDNLARNIIANLQAFGYRGDLYAVGRRKGVAHGVPIAASLGAVPDAIDLAVILTPAAVVPDLVDECGRKGIRWVVVESGGFSEFTEAGHRIEERLVEVARRWDVRFVGPNCISVINMEAGVCLPFASISPRTVHLGPASVVAQSGGVSITYLDRLSMAGVGVNKVVSIGNKADLDEVDYLAYLLDDPGTEIVCLYLESIGDGRQLMDLARSATKPVIVQKANRSQASQTIAQSHTAALADDNRIVDAAFRQARMLRAEDFRDAVSMAQGLVMPPVLGDDLVIISRSGGHAVVAADAAERHGFHLPPLPQSVTQRVRELFRADVIAPTNPLDLGVIFDFDLYARIVETCLEALAPDAVLLINTYSLSEVEGAHRLARRAEEIMREAERPVAFCSYSQGETLRDVQSAVAMPVFDEIEAAMRGLAASRDWHRWQRRGGAPHTVGAPPEAVALTAQPALLTADQALSLCTAYGVPVAKWAVADDVKGATSAAEVLGFPVAVKVLSAQASHKSDVGGVALDLRDTEAVERESHRILTGVPRSQLMVQRMIEGGVEVILGCKRDPSFGPVVMFGLGGVTVEVFEDVAFRVAPLSRSDAEEMVAEVRGSQLLDGVRGAAPADRVALVDALLAVSRLAVENPKIAELDINPLLVLEQGVVAVDARAVVAGPPTA
jgi:acetyltransferase